MNAEQKHINNILQVPVVITIISFVIGSAFFGLFIAGNEEIVFYGFFYVVIATVTNLIILLLLIVISSIYKDHQTIILQRTSLMLINIPVAILYLYFLDFI